MTVDQLIEKLQTARVNGHGRKEITTLIRNDKGTLDRYNLVETKFDSQKSKVQFIFEPDKAKKVNV
jgi:hypothetical protein